MKKFFFIVVALFATVAGLLTNTSCKKQQEESALLNGATQTEQDMSPSEQKVLDFLADYDAMKRGAKAEGEAVSPEQARWQWETSLNYCYGFTQDHLTDMREDTLHMAMPKTDAQGNIAYSDLLDTYANIVSAVRETYKSINMGNKTLKFVTVNFDNGSKDGDGTVTIVMNTGRNYNGIDPQGPFNVGECYPWGTVGATENPAFAPMKLYEKVCDYDTLWMAYHNPCPTCVTWIDSITEKTYYGYKENNDSLFHAIGLTCSEVQNYLLCYDDLNKEYFYMIKRGHYGQPTNLYNQKWYYCSKVYSKGIEWDQDFWSIFHVYVVKYCIRRWRHDGGLYPIPIDGDE